MKSWGFNSSRINSSEYILDSAAKIGHFPASMYAVIETGGKQYRVVAGDVVQVEKLDGEVGASLTLDQVLFVGKPGADKSQIWLGKPLLQGAKVQSEIVGQGRGEKVVIVKMKRRKQYRRTQGHRQFQTQLLITSIDNGAGETFAMSAEDKKAFLGKYYTQLAPKGAASTNPHLQASPSEPIAKASKTPSKKASAKPNAKPSSK